MLIEDYKDYLSKHNYSGQTVKIYSRRIQNFLDAGYSENDLIGASVVLFSEHSRGGTSFSEADHGNNRSALRKLNDFIFDAYIDTFKLNYNIFHGTFAPKNETRTGYTIDGARNLTISYNTGKQKRRKVKDQDFYALLKFLKDSELYLRKGDYRFICSPSQHVDAGSSSYDLEFGTTTLTKSNKLFEDGAPTWVNKEYEKIVNLIIARDMH